MSYFPLPLVDLCSGCGKCCEHIGLPPFEVANPDLGAVPVERRDRHWCVTDQRLRDMDTFAAMPAELRAEHARLVTEHEGSPTGKPCAWLDPISKKCSHYEHRPAVCRDWKPGEWGCCQALGGAKVVWHDDDRPDDYWNPRHSDPDPPANSDPWDREPNRLLSWAVRFFDLRRWWKDWHRSDPAGALP